MPERWVVVVPVKDAAAGKTRLSGALDRRARTALARAMALDTIAATVACPAVGLVVVVTADQIVSGEASGRGLGLRASSAAVEVIPEPSHAGTRSGLDAAAAAGVAGARVRVPPAPVGVLLGDLPALRPVDLGAALAAAEDYERATVPDAAGTGTTLLTVTAGTAFESRFGAGSAAAHIGLGYAPLDVPAGSTLRHDVDLPADLDALRELTPGPRTARLLDRLFPADEPAVRIAGQRG